MEKEKCHSRGGDLLTEKSLALKEYGKLFERKKEAVRTPLRYRLMQGKTSVAKAPKAKGWGEQPERLRVRPLRGQVKLPVRARTEIQWQ